MKSKLFITLFIMLLLSSLIAAVSCGAASQPIIQTATQPATGVPGVSAAVVIANFAFSPATLTVTAGTTVTWTNKDSATHTVTFAQSNLTSSGNMPQGGTFSFTFKDKGSYDYHCAIHPSMTGKVIVQ